MPKSWYEFKNKAEDSAEISIYDEIGMWGVSARHFASDLKALGDVKNIDVSINSPGGSLFDGLAIHNMLKRHPAKVTVIIDGIAASAASVIAMAGDEILMPENAFMMIHEASGVAVGTADDMREYADFLDKTLASLVSVYRAKTDMADDELISMIKAESWLSALDAVALGFATATIEAKKVAACCDMSRFENPPEIENLVDETKAAQAIVINFNAPTNTVDAQKVAEDLKAALEAGEYIVNVGDVAAEQEEEETFEDELDTAAQIAELCNAAGVSMITAKLIKDGSTVEQAQEHIKAAGEIRTICNTAKLPDRANDYIKAGLSVQEVRASLFDALAAKDMESDINPWHQPSNKTPAKGTEKLKAADIYAKRQVK
jgi:ATP-dependent Clp protease, protease subunit